MTVTPSDVRNAVLQSGAEAWFAEDMAKLHHMLASGYENVVTDDVHTVTGKVPRTLVQFAHDYADELIG